MERRRASVPTPMSSTPQVGIAIFLGSAALVFAAQGALPGCGSPLWSTEVLPELSLARGHLTGLREARHVGVVFSNDGRLIVFGVDDRVAQTPSRTVAERVRPFTLRLLLVDPASGKVTLRKEERTRGREAAVFPTISGLLVKNGPPLELYSPDLAQQLDLPFQFARNTRIRVSVSPTGKTIMFNDVVEDPARKSHSHFDVLDAGTLEVRYSWDESPALYHHYSISDRGIAAMDSNSDLIVVSEFGRNRWTTVGKPFGICFSGNMPTLYSDQELAYGCDRLVATSTGGQVLMTDVFPSGETSSGKTAVAQGGRYIAVSVHTLEFIRHFLAEDSLRVAAIRIRVYDMALKKELLTVSVNPLPREYYDFALSPDGSKLAVLNDRKVSVCRVPIQSTGRPETARRQTP